MKMDPSFDRLHQRLHRLNNDIGNEIELEYVYKHPIDDILEGGILTNDFENSLDLLSYYISEIKKAKRRLPSIIEKHNFTSLPSVFDSRAVSIEEIHTQKKGSLINEMDFYTDQLKKIEKNIIHSMNELGDDRFSNAGFRVRLELTVPEIGSLFNALLSERILKKTDGTNLTKKELGMFLFKNFASKDVQQFSQSNIVNYLSGRDIKSAGRIEEILGKMLEKFKNGT